MKPVKEILRDYENLLIEIMGARKASFDLHIEVAQTEKRYSELQEYFASEVGVQPEVMPKIDEYISKLQVYGYHVRLNNHNIGDIHNIIINRFNCVDGKNDLFKLKQIDYLQLRLPAEANKLFEVFEKLLKDAEKS